MGTVVRDAVGVPTELARRPLRAVRPADAVAVYAHPRQQLARLERAGVLHRIANGHYVVVPHEHVGTAWLPSLEAAAAAVSVSDVGVDQTIVMGISAARLHHATPRALGTAVVAVPRQRARLRLRDRDADVVFVRRDVARLAAELVGTDLGRVLVTTPEQTVLDLAHRPSLGASESTARDAARALLPRCEPDELDRIAAQQRLGATRRRLEHWVGLRA
jgi:predicted transcriptional regulator of viral defense system